MKKLLLAISAMCMAVSGFALTPGDFVYTPQGRFQIAGQNLNDNNTFQDFSGWTVITSAEKTLEDNFMLNANGYAEGFNSVSSTASTAGEGMYFQFVPTDASSSYVVSFKMKGAALVTTRISTIGYNGSNVSLGDVLTNGVKIEGNTDHKYDGTNDVLVCNTAEELTEDWQTFNYAIVGDGITRTYFISLTHMDTNVEIADLQIAPAVQMADLRQRDAMIEKLEVYKNCYNWPEAILTGFAVTETIDNLKAIGDESGQAELDEALETAQEVITEFLKANMDDYLAGNTDNYLGIKTTSGNIQKVNSYGNWTATTTGRAFWSSGDYPDLGHYQRGSQWNYNSPTTPMGIYMEKTLDPGSYVFAIEGKGAMRENATQTWVVNDGLNPAYGVAYIVKIKEGEDPDTVQSVVKDLKAAEFTQFLLPAKIEEAGTYELGFKAYCKEAYQEQLWGSVVYVKDASVWGKNANKYNQKQLGYEADVREQITTGRSNLTTAAENIASADFFWGKAELQECVDTVAPKIAAYEQLDQDAIIATYENDYEKSTTAETGYLVYTIYQEAVKDIIAANKKFAAVNDTLASIQVTIDAAETVKAMRIYEAATGKDALQAAIETAKDMQTTMKATDYTEENAAAIKAGNAALNEAVEAFKASVPASAIATVVDIDFEQDATQNAETGLYSIAGEAGSMEFSHFSTTAPEGEDAPFQQGHWANGEQKWKGYLRIGNGTGTVNFDATVDGSMGTNILVASCDFYIQGLSKRSVGFYLQDAEDNNVSGLYRNYYDGTSTYEPFGVDVAMIWAKSGGSYNDASPADAEEPTATVIQKTHFEVVMDYGRKSMYCSITSPNGSTTSEEVVLEGVPAKFVLQCDYDNKFATRRPWFDNLKIQRITAGPTDPFVPSGIQEINPAAEVKAPTKVFKNGRIVINGKYGINGMLIK